MPPKRARKAMNDSKDKLILTDIIILYNYIVHYMTFVIFSVLQVVVEHYAVALGVALAGEYIAFGYLSIGQRLAVIHFHFA